MHITGTTRYQRLCKLGRLSRRKVAINPDPTNDQPAMNIPSWGEELKWMFMFASSMINVIRMLIRPRGIATLKQTTRGSTDDFLAVSELS